MTDHGMRQSGELDEQLLDEVVGGIGTWPTPERTLRPGNGIVSIDTVPLPEYRVPVLQGIRYLEYRG